MLSRAATRDARIEKILGANLVRVFGDTWKAFRGVPEVTVPYW